MADPANRAQCSRGLPGFACSGQHGCASNSGHPLTLCARSLQQSGYHLMVAKDPAEEQAVLYYATAAASAMHCTVVVLVHPDGKKEGAAVQKALSEMYSAAYSTYEHDILLMDTPGSWQDLRKFKGTRRGVRQGTHVLLVPNSQPALEQLAKLLIEVNPLQLVALATADATPHHWHELPVHDLPCSSFIQVGSPELLQACVVCKKAMSAAACAY